MLVPGTYPLPGGAETQTLLVARALAASGRSIAIVTYDMEGRLPEAVDGVRIIAQRRYPEAGSRARRFASDLAALVRTLGSVDAEVFVQRAAGTPTGKVALLTRARRRRFVYSSANVIDFDYGRLERSRPHVWLFHLGVRLAETIVVQTDEQVDLCRGRFGRSPTLIRSIARRMEQRTADPQAFLWVGRATDYKRPEAFMNLARAVPEASFWMVVMPAGRAEREYAGQLERKAHDIANLELLPERPRDEMLELIGSAVAIVNTADYEGMPNVFLESWAQGVPALSLSHDPDGVIDREGLGRFAGGSPIKLSELTREMWRGRQDQMAVAERCQTYMVREHSPEAVVEGWTKVLR